MRSTPQNIANFQNPLLGSEIAKQAGKHFVGKFVEMLDSLAGHSDIIFDFLQRFAEHATPDDAMKIDWQQPQRSLDTINNILTINYR
jgi:hypothetical protein